MARARIPWGAVAIGGAAVVAVGVVAMSRRSSAAPMITSPQRVALIGDSYAVGLGPELAKLIPNFKFEGHVGTNTAQWANHTAACGSCGDWLTAFKPNLVLVSLGVNDGATPNITNYQRIVQGLNGLGAQVAWIEPPAAVRTQSRNVIDSLGGLSMRVAGAQTPLAADGLHPQSYGPWARAIAEAVTS